MPDSVAVARQPLELKSLVRIQAGQPVLADTALGRFAHPTRMREVPVDRVHQTSVRGPHLAPLHLRRRDV